MPCSVVRDGARCKPNLSAFINVGLRRFLCFLDAIRPLCIKLRNIILYHNFIENTTWKWIVSSKLMYTSQPGTYCVADAAKIRTGPRPVQQDHGTTFKQHQHTPPSSISSITMTITRLSGVFAISPSLHVQNQLRKTDVTTVLRLNVHYLN